jgi:DNA helicase-2/ATP-dependent DNA helicase PcrA
MMKNNWMERLNEAQLESVVTCDQPLRIVAGAGSGKTRVITTKIVYLISALNIYPSRILAVTFTNKAANEMKERVREMIGSENGEPFISTFHALCTRILRIEAENCNLQKKLYDYRWFAPTTNCP